MEKIIVLGGSLGGMDAFKSILNQLPTNYKYPIIYLFHQKIKGHAYLKELRQLTDLNVQEIRHNDSIKPGNLYVSPPNKHVLINSRLNFVLSSKPEVNNCRPSIDVFFKSFAFSLKSKAVCVLLSGSNKDGVNSLKYVIEHGGKVLIQSPESAFSPRMPQAALDQFEMLNGSSLNSIAKYITQL